MAHDSQGNYLIVEIKARCFNAEKIRRILIENSAIPKGIDHQIDTYFCVNYGRLKLREGTIENALIQYNRPNQSAPKTSKVQLYKPSKDSNLKSILTSSLGILTVVDKKREIYFIENVKFHLDAVQGLGQFVEIEAIDNGGIRNQDDLLIQCKSYMKLFGINQEDLVTSSYSDMLLESDTC